MKRSQILVVVGSMVLFSSCSLQSVIKKSANQQVSVDPAPLELHGDSVKFTVNAQLPPNMMKKKVTYSLIPEYQYAGTAYPLGDSITFDGDEINRKEASQQEVSFSFPYREEMSNGELNFVGVASHKKSGKSLSTPKAMLTTGVATTPKLVRIGQFSADEVITPIGYYMDHGYADQDELQPVEVEFFFEQGSARLRPSEVNSERGKFLKAFIASENVTRTVTITGTHSPEGSERVNRDLSKNRAEVIEKFYRGEMQPYDYRDESDSIQFIILPVVDDWSDFRLLLADYDKITPEQKEEYHTIIYGDGDFDAKEKKMQQLSTYKTVFNDLYPKLRIAKTEILTTKDKKSEAEISLLAGRIVRGAAADTSLTEEEIAFAAHVTPGLAEKTAIYEAQASVYNSALAHNNLGVAYLNQANRALNAPEKNTLLAKARSSFEKVNAEEENAYAYHNLGHVHLLMGDYASAYEAFYKVTALAEDNNELKSANEASLGAVNILTGDYKLAGLHLNNAPENEVNLFNKGLAFLLAEDYRNAINAFEESAIVNKDYGYGFYGLALVGAKTGDETLLYENLKKAVQSNGFLKKRAPLDQEFKAFADKPAFREAIR
ncbi:MAG TPA: hypothetical protein VKX33_01450 [Cyclobacteriaceae bacterium]|nr:hypothetical protein [Cyclobacteriaceae bacterium]